MCAAYLEGARCTYLTVGVQGVAGPESRDACSAWPSAVDTPRAPSTLGDGAQCSAEGEGAYLKGFA